MTHNSCREVTSVEFRDWMEVTVEVKRKKKKEKEEAVLLHYGLRQGACVLPAPSGGWRGEFVFMGWAHEKTSL